MAAFGNHSDDDDDDPLLKCICVAVDGDVTASSLLLCCESDEKLDKRTAQHLLASVPTSSDPLLSGSLR